MNALLVDDDRFVVAALEKKINWEQLTITEVLTAFNIRQAQKIIEKNSIDICVCDIEMPGGSGLDLLSWVRGGSGTLYQQSAIVGVISRRGSGRWSCPSQVALTSGSCAMGIREPGQGRNTAALSESSHVT